MPVRHRRIPPSRLSAAAAGEAPAAPYGTSAARESRPGSAPNATHDVPCPAPPPGRRSPRATPRPSGRVAQPVGPGSGGGFVSWRTRPSAGTSSWSVLGSATGLCPGGRGLRPGAPSRSVAGPAAGRPGRRGRPAGWSWVRWRGSVQADAASGGTPDLSAPGPDGEVSSRWTRSPAFGGDIRPVSPGPGGRVPSRRTPGLRRDIQPIGRGSGGGVPSRRTPGVRRDIQPVGRGSGGGVPSRPMPGVRRDIRPVGPGPGGGIPSRRTRCAGSVSCVGALPDREPRTGSSGFCRSGRPAPPGPWSVDVGPVPEAPDPAVVGMDTQTPFSSSSPRGSGPAPPQADPPQTP
ncbi:hypothetical protein SO3561_04411 [Streptomyces olivochromogenes]|uniref:Uncharacterized protein n=1 Tax=Streptomyces olivochromogenes TaxID=1963 RepID=A0A250VFQ3_STROL|nr:hypothetical protein SO3561_04411 [Streptomyces olivochromogenes]